MKSLYINGFRSFDMAERDKPAASPKRMTLKVKYTAICGSDNMFWSSNDYVGHVPGHEFSGYVEDPGDFPFEKGERVCAAEFNPCGECEFCKSGREQLCVQMMVDNPGVSAPGALGEYVSVRGDFVYRIPDDVPLELGSIVEPIAVSLHGVNYCDIQPGESILIWGNGPIGIYAAACAKLKGADKVYMVGRNQGRVDFCNGFEFVDKCLSVKDDDFEDQLKAITPAGGFPNVMDCLGLESYDQLAAVAKPGTAIVILGMHAPQMQVGAMSLYLKELSLRTGLYFSVADYEEAVKLVCEHKDLFLKTITSIIPHSTQAVQDAYTKLFASGNNNECKIVVSYDD